jgi:hypothetical protein
MLQVNHYFFRFINVVNLLNLLNYILGTPITNLRTIVRGSGEKPTRHAYDDELGSPSKRNNYRDSPDDYDHDSNVIRLTCFDDRYYCS